MEEERFNRVKKTTKFPVNAIRAWLDASGCSAADIDAVGYSWAESFIDQSIGNLYFEFQQAPEAHALDSDLLIVYGCAGSTGHACQCKTKCLTVGIWLTRSRSGPMTRPSTPCRC